MKRCLVCVHILTMGLVNVTFPWRRQQKQKHSVEMYRKWNFLHQQQEWKATQTTFAKRKMCLFFVLCWFFPQLCLFCIIFVCSCMFTLDGFAANIQQFIRVFRFHSFVWNTFFSYERCSRRQKSICIHLSKQFHEWMVSATHVVGYTRSDCC